MDQAGTTAQGDESTGVAEPGPIILVVDDDPLLGNVIRASLAFEGAEVRIAHTLAAAREELGPNLDHVVLDRRLPDGDGLELLPDLALQCPETPVVIFTAFDDEQPQNLTSVAKTDVAALIDLLGFERTA